MIRTFNQTVVAIQRKQTKHDRTTNHRFESNELRRYAVTLSTPSVSQSSVCFILPKRYDWNIMGAHRTIPNMILLTLTGFVFDHSVLQCISNEDAHGVQTSCLHTSRLFRIKSSLSLSRILHLVNGHSRVSLPKQHPPQSILNLDIRWRMTLCSKDHKRHWWTTVCHNLFPVMKESFW